MFHFDNNFNNISTCAEECCRDMFKIIDKIFEHNQTKVLKAFINNNVSEVHFNGTTGYGYGDKGRETLDKIFADVFNAESAMVRHNFTCGTHALTVCLFGILRPGDILVCITGKPYDTLEEVIGIRGVGKGSLKDFNILYSQIELIEQDFDYSSIRRECKDAKVVYIQRSKGYSLRRSFGIDSIKKVIHFIKNINKNVIVVVDNCYGEFTQESEPTDVFADLIVGSLIKNPGGGIAKTGGYIVGKKDLVKLCSYRFSAPGLGSEVGCTLDQNRNMLMGIFMAPQAVANALKTAIFCAALFEKLGFKTTPNFKEQRTDIVQSIELGSKENMLKFCKGIQLCSPIDSFVTPIEWNMPGYDSKTVMASGSFTMGSTIEVSADGPVKEPYVIWFQGGLTYPSGKLSVLEAAWQIYSTNN